VPTVPSLRVERELLRGGARRVAGVDEVGRGAIAGPVSVGVVVVDASTRTAPIGLRDSKLLSAQQREALEPAVHRWARTWAVGHAAPEEIDRWGIVAALRLAGLRALGACGCDIDVVLLDGSHDWLSGGQPDLFSSTAVPRVLLPPVVTRVKADLRCSSVAAASVAAKVARDRLMTELDAAHPSYGWAGNKGYSTPEHGSALRAHGLTPQHRASWRLASVADVDERERPAVHRDSAMHSASDRRMLPRDRAGTAAT
jgi:ribonuclease HII